MPLGPPVGRGAGAAGHAHNLVPEANPKAAFDKVAEGLALNLQLERQKEEQL